MAMTNSSFIAMSMFTGSRINGNDGEGIVEGWNRHTVYCKQYIFKWHGI